MDKQTIYIIIAVIGIICAIIMREIAKKKEANQTLWFIIGLILGPIAFLFIPFIKN